MQRDTGHIAEQWQGLPLVWWRKHWELHAGMGKMVCMSQMWQIMFGEIEQCFKEDCQKMIVIWDFGKVVLQSLGSQFSWRTISVCLFVLLSKYLSVSLFLWHTLVHIWSPGSCIELNLMKQNVQKTNQGCSFCWKHSSNVLILFRELAPYIFVVRFQSF